VLPEILPVHEDVIGFPQRSLLMVVHESVFPLTDAVKITLFWQAPAPTVPGIVTALSPAAVNVSDAAPPQVEVPFHVPANFAEAGSLFLVHELVSNTTAIIAKYVILTWNFVVKLFFIRFLFRFASLIHFNYIFIFLNEFNIYTIYIL
jgi:hypothetical protein